MQALQLQLTIADLVAEVHDTHHPIAASKYYEEQKTEAKARAASLRSERLPKFLGYFEQVLAANGGRHALREHSYVDLSLFQLLSGLDYMFPRRMQALGPTVPLLRALQERVAKRPNIAAYLASERRLPFNTNGIFRHYPELDAERPLARSCTLRPKPRCRPLAGSCPPSEAPVVPAAGRQLHPPPEAHR